MPELQTYPYFRTPRPTNPNAPLFIYLPGMDGTGLLLDRQLAGLEQGFDIRCLTIALNDLSSWDQLTEQVVDLVITALKQRSERTVHLCGESFGGCLALKVALHSPELFKHLILINPASSFKRHPWLQWGSYFVRPLPEPIHHLSCVSFLPFLAALDRMEADDRRALLKAMQSVAQETTVWRLSLLREFHVDPNKLSRLIQPALVIASGRDRLLPSVAEAEQLVEHIPNAQMHILPNSGHACLLEIDIDLYKIMQATGFMKVPQHSSPSMIGEA